MTRPVTLGLFAVAFAASAIVASTAFAQDHRYAAKRAPSTFDGQAVTRALVRGLAATEGLDYAWHDYCAGGACAQADNAFAALAQQAPGSALLFVEWRGAMGEPQAAILSETRCDAPRQTGVRSLRSGSVPDRTTGVRAIRSAGQTGDCLAGYEVLARFELAPS